MMPTSEYTQWITAGRPYQVANPIRELVTMARTAGISVLGVIGNDEHLKDSYPEDHTPFSRSAWPLPLPGYWVCACDLKQGEWCWQFLDGLQKGLYPWVKYINMFNKHYNIRNNWKPVYSSDTHFHASCRTDALNKPVGPNPFIKGGDHDMDKEQDRKLNMVAEWVAAQLNNSNKVVRVIASPTDTQPTEFPNHLLNEVKEINLTLSDTDKEDIATLTANKIVDGLAELMKGTTQ